MAFASALHFIPPYDSDFNTVDYDDYKLNLSLEDAKTSSKVMRAGKIEISSNVGSDNVMAEVVNTSTDYLEFIQLVKRCTTIFQKCRTPFSH